MHSLCSLWPSKVWYAVCGMLCDIHHLSGLYRSCTSRHSLLDQMSTNSSTATPFASLSALRAGHDRQQRNTSRMWSWWGASPLWSSSGPTTVIWRGREIWQAPVISTCSKLALHQSGRYADRLLVYAAAVCVPLAYEWCVYEQFLDPSNFLTAIPAALMCCSCTCTVFSVGYWSDNGYCADIPTHISMHLFYSRMTPTKTGESGWFV